MNNSDYEKFADAWATAHEAMPGGKVLSQSAMTFCFDALADYPLPAVMVALVHHGKNGRFAPAPKDIVDLLELGNKRPTADEALAMIPYNHDDAVVWTKETAAAWGLASDLFDKGNRFRAERAFTSAYDRLCYEAIMRGEKIEWIVSPGNEEGREQVLKEALRLGRITEKKYMHHLPHLVEQTTTVSALIEQANRISGNVTPIDKNLKQKRKDGWNALANDLKDLERLEAEWKQKEFHVREQKRLAAEAHREQLVEAARQKLNGGES